MVNDISVNFILIIILAPPVPFNVTILEPLSGNSKVDFVVTWSMPNPNLYYVSNYFIMYDQLRDHSLPYYEYVSGSDLKATFSASCPGEIVSAKVQAFSGQPYPGKDSKKSFPYQTGKSILGFTNLLPMFFCGALILICNKVQQIEELVFFSICSMTSVVRATIHYYRNLFLIVY